MLFNKLQLGTEHILDDYIMYYYNMAIKPLETPTHYVIYNVIQRAIWQNQ